MRLLLTSAIALLSSGLFTLTTTVAVAHTAVEAKKSSYRGAEADSRAFLAKIPRPARKPGQKPSADAFGIPGWVKTTLVDMVNTNSGSNNPAGLEAMRKKVKPLFTQLGYKVQEITVADDIDANGKPFKRKVLVFDVPGTNPDILIIGHLDTVFELSSPFQKFAEDGQKWRGPGVADMKGGLVLAAHMLSEIRDPALLKRIRIIINDDEERGSAKSGTLLKQYADMAQVGLIFESSPNADITSSHSGMIWYETTVYGVASHAGQAHAAGVNACLENSFKMIELYKRIMNFTDYSRSFTINAGIVNTAARAKPNITCDEIKTTYDVRYVNPDDAARARVEFQEVMAQHSAPNLKGVPVKEATWTEAQHYPAMPADRTQELVEIYRSAASKLGFTIEAKHKGAVDAFGIIGSPLKLLSGLGVYGDGLHSENESMQADVYMHKLQMNVAFLRELLQGQQQSPPPGPAPGPGTRSNSVKN